VNPSIEREQKLYDALKCIRDDFDSVERIKRTADKDFGVSPNEAVEMAYENLQFVAKRALKGMRRPVPNPPKF
jgi:hypothetical protein